MKRRRRSEKGNEQVVELDQVLEPYDRLTWEDEKQETEPTYVADNADDIQMYAAADQAYYGDEYSEAHDAADSESRFRFAIGMFDLISIVVGIAVVFVLAGMLITLFNWLRNDILHSALFLQSGLK